MERLNDQQERLVQDFAFELAMIDGPDDMFPPDDTEGVREPRRPIAPSGFHAESIGLAAVYDLMTARVRRQQLARSGQVLLHDIDLVTC